MEGRQRIPIPSRPILPVRITATVTPYLYIFTQSRRHFIEHIVCATKKASFPDRKGAKEKLRDGEGSGVASGDMPGYVGGDLRTRETGRVSFIHNFFFKNVLPFLNRLLL